MFVKDIMTKPAVAICGSTTVEAAIRLMRTHQVCCLVVEDGGVQGPYGLLTEEEIVNKIIAQGRSPHIVSVDSIMRCPFIQMSPNTSLQEAAQVFSDTGTRWALVMENGQLLGLVSLTDVLLKGHSQELAGNLRSHGYTIADATQRQQECHVTWQVLGEMRPAPVRSSLGDGVSHGSPTKT